MAYRCGDRYQTALFPQSIEEYVAEDDPVRAYDAFVDALNFQELGIELDKNKVGNSEYDPKSMIKLLVYGYSYGVKSSRKLERECHHNIAFVWLMGGLKPDHKTIAEFRRRNKTALKRILRQCARLCIKLDLIAGNVLFVDGTKIRANAARNRTHKRSYYEKLLTDIDRRIEKLLTECESIDRQEQSTGSYVAMDKELAKTQNLRGRIKQVLETFRGSAVEQVNQTSGCAYHGQGSRRYNVQRDDKQIIVTPTLIPVM
jgi:transposase